MRNAYILLSCVLREVEPENSYEHQWKLETNGAIFYLRRIRYIQKG